jgi:hypothetical protein
MSLSLRYLITGTGRNGTGYAAQVLASAGVPCGHEQAFGYEGPVQSQFAAEASWMAAPWLDALENDVRIMHLVRNPRDVILSLLRIGFFDDDPPERSRPYVNFAMRHCPELAECRTPQARAATFYVTWNRRIEAALERRPNAARVQVETGPEGILAALGIEIPEGSLFDDRQYNSRRGDPVVFEIEDLAPQLQRDLQAIANDYGYSLEPEPRDPQVYWAVLWERNVLFQAADALLDVSAICMQHGYTRIAVPYMAVDDARNQITALFLSGDGSPEDTLVMLDNDHAHPRDIVPALATRPEGVVGALAFRRWPPHDPLWFVRQEDGSIRQPAEWVAGQVYECDAVGAGAIAIKRWVFERLLRQGVEPPFWRMTYGKGGTREDMSFALACERAGIKHACHTGVQIPHLSTAYVDSTTWQNYRREK